MKIALAQLNYIIGDVAGNCDKIIDQVTKAKQADVDLIVFSELALSGYPPKDMLDYPSFINLCTESLDVIRSNSQGIGVLVGSPSWSGLKKGKKLYNSAFLYKDGKQLAQINKSLLPTYDIFDEYRYFEPASEVNVVEFMGERLAITICEDLWNLTGDHIYPNEPMAELIKQKPSVMINLSGSPYSYNHVEDRRERMQFNAKHYNLPLFYVNQVGGNTDILFDGGSMFINKQGEIAEECAFFKEDFKVVDWDSSQHYPDNHEEYRDYDIRLIHDAVVMGLKDYFGKLGFKKAILGSSGGIDSAVVHALAVEALGKENVQAFLLPSQYSSKGSVDDAIALANNLSSQYTVIDIESTFESFKTTLNPVFANLEEDVTEENLQARTRGVLLMAISNKFGSILLNTSNKSESAVGYTTLYGDLCGGLSIIGDLYKQQVYAMARFINRNGEIIPSAIINKEPSAELRPDQKDSDSLPDYKLLDKILFHYIEERKGLKEIVQMGFDEGLVKRILRMVDRNEYKRFQAPPTLRISHKAFGFGRRMPIVGKYHN
ncbi:MAG: NAD+ synthase [Bacteroidia bacterium]